MGIKICEPIDKNLAIFILQDIPQHDRQALMRCYDEATEEADVARYKYIVQEWFGYEKDEDVPDEEYKEFDHVYAAFEEAQRFNESDRVLQFIDALNAYIEKNGEYDQDDDYEILYATPEEDQQQAI